VILNTKISQRMYSSCSYLKTDKCICITIRVIPSDFQYKNFKPKYSSCSYLKAAKCLDKWAKQNSWHSLRVINVCFMTICHCMEPTRNRQPIPIRPPHPHHTPCCQGRNRNLDGWVAGWSVGSSRPNQTECNEGLK